MFISFYEKWSGMLWASVGYELLICPVGVGVGGWRLFFVLGYLVDRSFCDIITLLSRGRGIQ
jgi:hypothetical protein